LRRRRGRDLSENQQVSAKHPMSNRVRIVSGPAGHHQRVAIHGCVCARLPWRPFTSP
jgi:hypothetical protein